MPFVPDPVDQLAITTIRTLSIDAVQQANSGHPGAPMGAAPMAYVLWSRFLRHAPDDPAWPGRDRFVLSAGHASMLLYSLLHLSGYGVSLDDLRRFRQWESITPGHPERGLAPGVEVTTGPLGQGFANGVGMAIAQRRLAEEFDRPGHAFLDHWTYVLCSDGDLQEGIAAEAASLAGHLRLGRLVYLWDDNHVQLDGPTSAAWGEDVLARFAAYGWHTERVGGGNDMAAIHDAIERARSDPRPSLIAVRTTIGFGSPNRAGTSRAHGQALGADEVRLTKETYGWDVDATFLVPPSVRTSMGRAVARGRELVADWEARVARYSEAYPAEASELRRRLEGRLPADVGSALPVFEPGDGLATRQASSQALGALAGRLPELFGGSADLFESTLTEIKGGGDFTAERAGRNVRFGVREHAMGGIANGIAAHGGLMPHVSTFLTFSDYMRGAVRLAALSGLHVIYVWTHDSVGLGEDGPTHQPVEQLAALRAMPNLWVLRPGDANETSASWAVAVERRDGPVALILSRQKLPTLQGTAERAREGVRMGGYVLVDHGGAGWDGTGATVEPDLVLIATGSELQLAVGAAAALAVEGIRSRVVSLPSWERFDGQDAAYRDAVLPPACARRLTIEAGASFGWERYARDRGAILGLDRFGASAPGATVLRELGFTTERVTELGRLVVREGLSGRVGARGTPGIPGTP